MGRHSSGVRCGSAGRQRTPNRTGMQGMGTKLTEREIDRLACPLGKRDCMVFDTEQRGLAVRVVASGSKSYLAQYVTAGRKRRVPLGSVDAISLAAARAAARAVMGASCRRHRPGCRAQGSGGGRQGGGLAGAHDAWPAGGGLDTAAPVHPQRSLPNGGDGGAMQASVRGLADTARRSGWTAGTWCT